MTEDLNEGAFLMSNYTFAPSDFYLIGQMMSGHVWKEDEAVIRHIMYAKYEKGLTPSVEVTSQMCRAARKDNFFNH